MNHAPSSDRVASGSQRPGPFGPAYALLPKGQQPLLLDEDTPASDAIERLIDNGFSQIPVTDKSGRIIGVFTWRSFGKRVSDLHATNINPTELPIREAMERAQFIGPEVYIDTETDWSNIDHVLVGRADDLVGILCISDVFGRLNDFAEAFVLLYEIEHEIRDLIHDVYDDGELAEVLDAMMASARRPATEAVDELQELIRERGTIPAVGKAIRLLRAELSGRLESLEDFTFSQYRINRLARVSDRPFRSRLGRRPELLGRYREWLEHHEPDSPFVAEIEAARRRKAGGGAAARVGWAPARAARAAGLRTGSGESGPHAGPVCGDGPVCGEELNFRALAYAPTNEKGVLVLFGAVAEDLGFRVNAIGPGFPDCEAMQALDAGRTNWQRVRIEFEHRSRNFREHGHDPAGCDLVVCWKHDWDECPLQILELSSEIWRLSEQGLRGRSSLTAERELSGQKDPGQKT